MASHRNRFGELLRQSREQANQTAEVMAILLSMKPSDYLSIEAGLQYPDDDTLRKLCLMMEWNYLETQRLIRNELSAPRGSGGQIPAELGSGPLEQRSGGNAPPMGSGASRAESLGSRLKEVRLATGQAADIIAALLNVPVEIYLGLEEDDSPSDDLLRRISMVYNWNYNELRNLLRSGQARELQPHLAGNPFPAGGQHQERLRTLCRELEAGFAALPEPEQELLLAQLELVHSTALRRRHKAEPANPTPNAPSGAYPGTTGRERTDKGPARRRPLNSPPFPAQPDRRRFS